MGDPGEYLENNAEGGFICECSSLQSSRSFCTKVLVEGIPSHLEKCSSILFRANSYRKLSLDRGRLSILAITKGNYAF